MCYEFIQLIYDLYFQFCICYIDQLWQEGHLVLDEVGVNRGSMVYPLAPSAPPTTSTAPASTTPMSDGCSVPPGPHTQEFVMIPNPGYHNSGPQPLFPQQQASPPLPPPLEGEVCTQPASTPFPTPSQPGSQGAQASSSTPSQCSTNQQVELRYDGKSQ